MTEPLATARTVRAARGADWLAEGWGLFRRAPSVWLVISVIWLVLIGLSLRSSGAPSLALTLLTPLLIGGLMVGCAAQARGEPIRIDHVWAGCNDGRAGPLLMLGVFSLLSMLLIGLVVVLVLGTGAAAVLGNGGGLESLEIGTGLLIGLLLALLLLVPASMALWFAPALVAVGGLSPTAAMKASFRACTVNMGAMLVNGLLVTVITVVASIPLWLGWLVALPVIMASIYFGYRDIFAAEAESPHAASRPGPTDDPTPPELPR